MARSLGLKDSSITGNRSLDRDALIGTRKRFTDVYWVQADNKGENEDDIMVAAGIPPLRSLSNGAFLISKTPREVSASALVWELACQYDSRVDVASLSGEFGARRDVDWTWGAEKTEKVLQQDAIDKRPIVNGVGEPLIITAPIAIPVLTITRIQDNFQPSIIIDFLNHTNSSTFWGAPKGTALMADIRDEPVDIDGTMKRRVSYVIKFDLSLDPETGEYLGWSVSLLNHGTKYWNPTSATGLGLVDDYSVFLDLNKNPTTGNLTSEGGNLAIPFHKKLPLGNDPEYLKYNRFPEANFNSLQLGPFV